MRKALERTRLAAHLKARGRNAAAGDAAFSLMRRCVMPWKRLMGGLFLLIGYAIAGGCLEFQKTSRWRYDEERDEFSYLTVYENFATTQGVIATKPRASTEAEVRGDEDAAFLEAFYRNRAHLLPNPIYSPWLMVLSEPAALRREARQWAVFDLRQGRGTQLVQRETAVSLEKVRILPGELYATAGGGVGYYHQVVVPGAVVDAWLEAGWHHKAFEEGLKEEIAKEKAARRETPGLTWEEATPALVDLWRKKLHDQTAEKTAVWRRLQERPLAMLEDRTLDLYAKDGLEKASVSRDHGTLTLHIPMGPKDGAAISKLFTAFKQDIRGAAAEMLKPLNIEQPDSQEWVIVADKLLGPADMHQEAGELLTVRIDLKQWVAGANTLAERWQWPQQADESRVAMMAKAMREKRRVKEGIKLADIIAAFQRGALAASPAEAVRPGEGMREEGQ